MLLLLLLLLLLVLLLLLLFLLLLLLLILLILLLFLVLIFVLVLILLLLLLFLEHLHSLHKVVTCVVVFRVVAERLLVSRNGFVVLLLCKIGIAEVVVTLGKLFLVLFTVKQLRGFLILGLCLGILVLFEKRIAQVVVPLERIAVFLQSAAVVHLCCGEILLVVLLVASAYIGGFLLCKSPCCTE